jgi:uncharacterized protein YvpB
MYSFNNTGLGVYHGPIAELAKEYLGEHVFNFTGSTFDKILDHVNQNYPVWVITNTMYQKLDSSYFQTYHTEQGTLGFRL